MAVKTKAKPAKGKPAQSQGFDETNRGVLFPNDKDGNESRPDYTGHIFINPEDFEAGEDGLVKIRLAAWIKESERVGGQYYSLSASAPQA
jgi:hypothetical protein